MYPQGLMSMYQTAGGQGLFWELKVAAQESQKLFLPEIEEHLITPLWVLLPAAGGHHTGQERKRTGSAQVSDPNNLANPDFQGPANQLLKNCDTALQFQEQERGIHQCMYNQTPCLLPY